MNNAGANPPQVLYRDPDLASTGFLFYIDSWSFFFQYPIGGGLTTYLISLAAVIIISGLPPNDVLRRLSLWYFVVRAVVIL
jgi:hypothetical protein